ncbi:hypothetical protein GGX14DRAFT_388689 [Mycena pura]|uniref:Uncharacterized protein n=1 Tax=Mycena pura TaxID=153505 RepID=A0AAD6VTH0_9AGAR|nr:hypothetical protein GGX14DRAFT_388689 [Mycena pura]
MLKYTLWDMERGQRHSGCAIAGSGTVRRMQKIVHVRPGTGTGVEQGQAHLHAHGGDGRGERTCGLGRGRAQHGTHGTHAAPLVQATHDVVCAVRRRPRHQPTRHCSRAWRCIAASEDVRLGTGTGIATGAHAWGKTGAPSDVRESLASLWRRAASTSASGSAMVEASKGGASKGTESARGWHRVLFGGRRATVDSSNGGLRMGGRLYWRGPYPLNRIELIHYKLTAFELGLNQRPHVGQNSGTAYFPSRPLYH